MPDELARALDVDVALGSGCPRRLVGSGVAGDEREPLGARREAVAGKTAPDARVRDDDPAPLKAAQLGGNAARPEARVGDREGEDALLDHLREPR
jgi:hypothetical protein